MDHEEYLKRVRSYIKVPTKEIEEQLDQFCKLCTYVSGQYDQDDSFVNLNNHLEEIEKGRQGKEQNRVFYMALPPSVFITVSEQLKRNCYPKNGLARIIVSILAPGRWKSELRKLIILAIDRSRNPSVRIFKARATFKRLWSPIGRRMRFSVSTTTLARRWSRTFLFCGLAMSSLMPHGIVTTSTMFRYGWIGFG